MTLQPTIQTIKTRDPTLGLFQSGKVGVGVGGCGRLWVWEGDIVGGGPRQWRSFLASDYD